MNDTDIRFFMDMITCAEILLDKAEEFFILTNIEYSESHSNSTSSEEELEEFVEELREKYELADLRTLNDSLASHRQRMAIDYL